MIAVAGPYLVVGPLSTLSNWVKEFERFAPEIPVVLYHGKKDSVRYFIKYKKI
tara:strand:- start:923 stop:1081 length:159 start_codon:yes stop_codon:yes gene_type:complete